MKNILIFGILGVLLTMCGCINMHQAGTVGYAYDTIHTIERKVNYDIWGQPIAWAWVVYLTNDHGTGGDSSSNYKGSYCIDESKEGLLDKLHEYAESGERVKLTFRNEYISWGCDYDSRIIAVE